MVTFISLALLLYLIQLILPNALKAGTGYAKRAGKALKNISESLPVFLALAILSIILSVDENTMLALYWLVARLVFAVIMSKPGTIVFLIAFTSKSSLTIKLYKFGLLFS